MGTRGQGARLLINQSLAIIRTPLAGRGGNLCLAVRFAPLTSRSRLHLSRPFGDDCLVNDNFFFRETGKKKKKKRERFTVLEWADPW